MRKLIVLILIMFASFTLQAQQLNGTREYSNRGEFGGSKYSIINWTVNYHIHFERDAFYIRLSNPKVSVSPSSLYGTPDKFYSKSDLGISTWPHTDPTPYGFMLEITLIYPDGSYHKTGVSINEYSFIENNSKFKNAGISSFKVASVENMNYNGAHDQKLDELIAAKKNDASKPSKNTSNSEQSNNNTLTQTGTTNTSNQTNNTTAKPLDNYDPNTGLYTNPMANNTNSSSSTVDNFNKNYQQGQQIADAVMPLATGLVDAWNRKIDRENAAIEKGRLDQSKRVAEYQTFCSETNKMIFDWPYYEKNVIQKLPLMLESQPPSWASILGTEEFSNVFGKDANYIIDNFKPFKDYNSNALKQLKTNNTYPLKTSSSFFDFYAVSLNTDYKYNYFMDNEKLNNRFNTLRFIYNENKIVIGISIEIDTEWSTKAIFIEKYYKDIISKIGNNYIMLDANTFLLRDKLIIFELNAIHMYDINFMGNQLCYKISNILKANPTLNLAATKFGIAGLSFNETLEYDLNKIKWKSTHTQNLDAITKKFYYKSDNIKNQLIITKIDSNSPWAKAGLMEGDIIKTINDISIPYPLFFRLSTFAYRSLGNMNVTYLREGKEYETTIKLN